MKFIQASCVEGNKPDYRQADVVLRHKPDIIIFEFPTHEKGRPESPFNKQGIDKKPFKKVEGIKASLRETSKKYPYALSDVRVWENIEKLWREGKNTLLFNVDTPAAIRGEHFKRDGHVPYSVAVKKVWFWVYLYIREKHMSRNVKYVLKKYAKRNFTVAIFLQSIHWEHVEFLMKNRSKKAEWEYYFGRFKLSREEVIDYLKKEKRNFDLKEFKKVEKW